MKVRELKLLLAGIPDEVEVGISDMQDFSSDFEVGTYHGSDQTYIDLIMPKYITGYFNEGSDEQVTLL
jgi:hypothetical protein